MAGDHATTPHGPHDVPGDEPVIDLVHLDGFTAGDPQLEDELAALFLSTAEVYAERMSQALAAGEPWTGTAHALKGASANLGALRLAAIARRAERTPPDAATLDEIRSALHEIRDLFQARRT